MTQRNLSRRRVLRASAAAAAGLGGIGSAAASGVGAEATGAEDSTEFRRIPCRDLSDAEFRTEPASPTAVPEQARGIRPGSQMFIHYPDGTTAGCTANFVWREDGGSGSGGPPDDPGGGNGEGGGPPDDAGPPDDGGSLYIGAAGHCFLPGDTNASENAQRPEEDDEDVYDVSQLEVEVCADCTFGGATGLIVVSGETFELGEVAYARQNLPNGDQVGHDFGVVEIPERLADAVDPSLPQWGGPHGVSPGAVPQGEPVHQYGAGVGNGEVFPTMGSSGVSQGDRGTEESWVATIRASPGDSGSPLLSSDPASAPSTGDDAAGILTHLVLSGSDPFRNGSAGTTISRCKEMAAVDVDLDLAVEQVDETADG